MMLEVKHLDCALLFQGVCDADTPTLSLLHIN